MADARSAADTPVPMPDPPAKRAKSSGKPLELRYFTVLAKGLGPALVLEYSGLEWLGSKGLGFTRDMWPALKPGCPFGQLPLLVTADGTQIAQTTAIMNYVGRLAGTEGDLNEFALSQMLMAEAEDIYHLAQKCA